MSVVRIAVPPGAAMDAQEADRPRRGRPPARNEILRSGKLGGLDPESLAERFETPFYVYDLDVVERQVAELRGALPRAVEVAYAVKANPAIAVVARLGSLSLGADVGSGAELQVALRAGIAGDQVIFTGPGKRDSELRLAVRSGIRAITVESLGEMERLERIAAEERQVARILLRAAVPLEVGLERVRLVGDDGAGKFGMDRDDVRAAALVAVRSPYLEPLGIHAFGASNVLDVALLVSHATWTAELAREVATAAGFRLRLIDIGGGLGIPYEPDDRALDVALLGRLLTDLIEGLEADPVTREARVLLEPGRFLVGPAGAYVARVVDRKNVEGRHIVVLDGGVHHVLRPALVGQEHRIRTLGARSDQAARAFPVTVAGPLCSGLDILTGQAVMSVPEVGELVAVLDVGAYGYTESMPFFLSHPLPAEVAILGGRAELIRRRIEPEVWLDFQLEPVW